MLPNIRSLILDMDGVIWKGDAPIGNLPRIFQKIDSHGLGVVFATNNGTRTPEEYVQRLAKFGIIVQPWQVVTSSLGLAHLMKKRFPFGTPIYAIGENGLKVALQENGFKLLPEETAEQGQAVAMGIDWNITFSKMSEAALLVSKGIPFYATNSDKTFPTPRGEIPGAGSWISVLTTATSVFPIFAGKPAPFLFDLACERLGTEREKTLVVGDRLETDIAGGQASGCPVALVLSGVSTDEQGSKWTPSVDYISSDLESLVNLLFPG